MSRILLAMYDCTTTSHDIWTMYLYQHNAQSVKDFCILYCHTLGDHDFLCLSFRLVKVRHIFLKIG